MQPIVNGLDEEYGAEVAFVSLNARDGAMGESLFAQLALRGHPGIIIYNQDGGEVYRGIGVIDEQTLIHELDNLVDL